MKKWFIIAVLSGGLYFYASQTQMGKEHWRLLAGLFDSPAAQNLAAKVSSGGSDTQIYKTQNPDGSWTFSDQKPASETTKLTTLHDSEDAISCELPPEYGSR